MTLSITTSVAALVFILICLIWGSTWLAIKIGLTDAPPLTIAALRFALAMVVLAGICRVRGYALPRRSVELLRLGYPGFFMYGLAYGLVFLGMQHVNSAVSAVLFASYPFFVAIFAWLLYRTEKLGRVAWIGMAVGFAGVLLISYDSFQSSGSLWLGTIMIVGSAASSAYGIVIHRHRFPEVNIVVAALVQMVFGGIFLVAGAILFEDLADFHFTVASVGSIIYLAIPGTVITFLGYYWLLKRIRITVVALIAFITPLVAITAGVLLAEESLTPLIIAGSALILSGVFLVVRK